MIRQTILRLAAFSPFPSEKRGKMCSLKSVLLAASTLPTVCFAQVTPPRSAEITPFDLASMRSLSSVVVSPDGRYAAFRMEIPDPTSNRWSQEWLLSSLATGATRKLADAGDVIDHLSVRPDPEAPQWSTDSKWLYFRAAENGHVGLRRVNIETRRVESLGDASRYLASFQVGIRSVQMHYGAIDAMVAEKEEQDDRNGFVLDSTQFAKGELFRGHWFRGRWATINLGPGNTWPRQNALHEEGGVTRILDLTSLKEHAAGPSDVAEFSDFGRSERETGAFLEPLSVPGVPLVGAPSALAGWKSTANQEFRIAWRRPDGSVKACDAEACKSKSVKLISQKISKYVLFSSKDDFNQLLIYRWDYIKNSLDTIWKSDGAASGDRIEEGASYDGTCPIAGGKLICIYSKPRVPERLVKIDLVTGEVSELYDPNPGLVDRVHADLYKIAWTVAGRHYFGMLVTPRASRKATVPLLIPTYRCEGGFMRGASAEEFPIYSFVEAGIAVLCADNNLDRYRNFPDRYAFTFEAWKAVIPILEEKYGIDRARVGIAGQSYGAEIAAYSLMHSSIFKAASLGDPTVDPILYYLYGAGNQGQTFLHSPWWGSLPNPTTGLDQWRRISLALNADKVSAPILMQTPEEELPAAMQLWTAMYEADKPFELVAFPREPHAKFQPAHKLSVNRRNFDWFRFWLLGLEDPSPAKRNQYARWQAMKAVLVPRQRLWHRFEVVI